METAMKTARSIAQRTKDVTWITRVLDAMAAKKSTAARAEAEYDRLLRDPALSDEEFTSVLSRLLDLRKRRSDTSDAKRTLAEAFNMRPVVTTRRIFFHLSLADYRPMLPNMARRLEMEAKRQPQNDSLKEWLVRTYEEMREPEKAARLYEEIAKTTDNYVFLSECARKMRSSGNKRGAWKMRIDFLHRHAERTDMRLEHFNLLRNDGRYQEALEVYGDPLRGLCASPFPARSNNLNANLNALLECYSKLGKLNEFARLIRHELIRHPEVFHLRLILGDVQTKAGNTAAAQETWLELARRKDLTRWQRILLAHRLETAGKLETALEQLLKAAELPVSRQERETITMNISIFIPWDQRQVQSQGKLLGDIMRLQGKLGQNSAAAATRRRIPMVGKALGLED
jgi:tetratricopeptide (TPR) repeat protein